MSTNLIQAEAHSYAKRLEERLLPFVEGEADAYDDDDERVSDIPEHYGQDYMVLVHTYGGGPAGGVVFYLDGHGGYSHASTWHQDWFTPKEYAPLDDEIGEWLFNHWNIDVNL